MKTFKGDISSFGGSLTTLVPFLIELKFTGNVGFQGQAKTGVPGEKPLGEKKTNHKLDQHMGSFFWRGSYKERKRAYPVRTILLTYRTLTWQKFKQHLHNTRKPDKYTVYLSPWCTGLGYWISGTFRFYDEEDFSMRFSQYRVARAWIRIILARKHDGLHHSTTSCRENV